MNTILISYYKDNTTEGILDSLIEILYILKIITEKMYSILMDLTNSYNVVYTTLLRLNKKLEK